MSTKQQAVSRTDVIEKRIHVEPDLPIFSGHFPSHPLVPAAMQLCWMINALTEHGHLGPWDVKSAKFLSPLAPGTDASLTLEKAGSKWQACLSSAGCIHARATIESL